MLNRAIFRTKSNSVHRRPIPSLSRTYSNNISSSTPKGSVGTSPYMEQMYETWKVNPTSIHSSWGSYFSKISQSPQNTAAEFQETQKLRLIVAVQQLIRAYQVMGHNRASLDPLGLMKRPEVPSLDPITYGITETQMDTSINRNDLQVQSVTLGFLSSEKPIMTIREILETLQKTYCQTVGVEYMHIQSRTMCNWIRERIEANGAYMLTKEEMLVAYDRLAWATLFELYLGKKFTDKRYGSDGGEVVIAGLKFLIDEAGEHGATDIVFGMAHRGRLNVLANVLRKPLESIFHEFSYGTITIDNIASGDVKYHLGTNFYRPTRQGKKVHISLLANPSHLETVNPVVEGKVAAKEFYQGDKDFTHVIPVLIHGDASVAGQGVVYETVTMSSLPKFRTGGTIHVIINNQLGFTTNPEDGRPGQYCTDVMKSVGAPIFHVNGDDPDAVCWVFKLAAAWRQKWHEDVVVDIVCYRRFGHNEVDQPKYTQPLLYDKIEKHPNTLEIYGNKLLREGYITKDEITKINAKIIAEFDKAFDAAADYKVKPSEWLSSKWEGFKGPEQLSRIKNTSISKSAFDSIAKAIVTLPPDFTLHPNLKRTIDQKKIAFEKGEPLDWATGEAMAYGSLLLEGFHVRLTGQDVERGTFSHRHAILHDQHTGVEYCPLNNIPEQKVPFSVKNSFLSEYAALGYEVGFTLESPNALVMWEAQFGDFANGAQIIIDQYISSGEQKWICQSDIVLLLPHGYEGMGPEHSSARIERFLQMSDQDISIYPNTTLETQLQQCNWQLVNSTTPANLFHVLRRQIHRNFRKPLILFTPKSLLRHPLAKSPQATFLDDGDVHSKFMFVYSELDQDMVADDKVRRVIFCSGKVYYDIYEERARRNIKDITIVRVEQLAPFPFEHVLKEIQRYPNAEVIWCQEEPKNMGAWSFMYFSFVTTLKHLNDKRQIKYVGRSPSASPSTGSSAQHKRELAKFLNEALSFNP